MKEWILPTAEATGRFGEVLGRHLRGGEVIGLIGDLGAGKTTITQGIARGLKIKTYVTSPTFGLVHEYPGPIPLFHFDPYRLDRAEDLYDIGFLEYLERNGVVVVEWADRFPELLPNNRVTLKLAVDAALSAELTDADAQRTLQAEAKGARYQSLLEALARSEELDNLLAIA